MSQTKLRTRLQIWLQSLTRTTTPNPNGVHQISARQIYILPTRYGLLYATMLLGMLLGANNYGSNPAFLLTFLLTGVGLAALFQTWKNLLHLELTPQDSPPVHNGNPTAYPLTINNPHKSQKIGLQITIQQPKRTKKEKKKLKQEAKNKTPNKINNNTTNATTTDLPPNTTTTITIQQPTHQRGLHQQQKLTLQSQYPLGLFRAWAIIGPKTTCLVYPKPADKPSPHDTDTGDTRSQTPSQDNDDFIGHKRYEEGENLMHIDWKLHARSQQMKLKNFQATQGGQVWLKWQTTQGETTEQKLSHLTRAILNLHTQNKPYGLELPNTKIAPNNTEAHKHQCLKSLALLEVHK